MGMTVANGASWGRLSMAEVVREVRAHPSRSGDPIQAPIKEAI